jgi:amphiphysin
MLITATHFRKQSDGQVTREIETTSSMVNSMAQVREELMPQLQDIERLVIAPAGEYLTLFEQVKKYMVKRSHKLLDYDRHKETRSGRRLTG